MLGYQMWWRRGRGRRLRAPAAKRRLAAGAGGVLIPLSAVLLLVGWFLPLFGIPLAAFLILDTAVGAI
ncbi:hypothetical protein [Streptomyces litchfieldiae]|uniref:hypothetical protein n=1 Tax=Streptomyces litchfieldiae TaxID=3075543 RepID=UPI00374E1C13